MLNQSALIKEQKSDPVLRKLASNAVSEQEADKVVVCYYLSKAGVLMRKWRIVVQVPEIPEKRMWKKNTVNSAQRQTIKSQEVQTVSPEPK